MTSMYEEGLELLDEKFGNRKDNLISLATVVRESGTDGKPRPAVRCVDAYYEDCTFYIVTYGKSNKILQIEQNTGVAVALSSEMFTTMGVGESLGWALDPRNVEIRTRLRTAFTNWYDMADNEKDENYCILTIYFTRGALSINHWEKLYHLDFVDKTNREDGGII